MSNLSQQESASTLKAPCSRPTLLEFPLNHPIEIMPYVTRYIVITGNPVNGLHFNGPFESSVKAMDWGSDQMEGIDDWWIAKLEEPR